MVGLLVSNIKYLSLHPSSLLSVSLSLSLMQQEETFISALTGLYTECLHHRNTHTYVGPENNQVKNVVLATEKS